MNRRFYKYSCKIILLVYIILFGFIKQPYHEWDRIINSDGKAYYAYLTGIFIYHDLKFGFADYYETKYYPADRSTYKEFRMDFKGERVNKTFPGLALLWLPFFLIAHLLTLLAGLPADGYSILYQYAIGLAALFYLWAGCRFLKRLLRNTGASESVTSFIVIIIAFGTNIIYYAVNEGTMPHVYNFALISAFLLFAFNAIRYHEGKWFILSSFVFALILTVRPQNGLIILAIPLLAGSKQQLQSFLSFLQKNKIIWINIIIPFLIIISVPLILWYMQTGHLLAYTYGEESFNFANPRIIKLLFSYEKGWLLYTPVAALSFTGFIKIWKNKIAFFSLLLFWLLFVYISSCWWIWNYTSRFGQRIFIDFYPLIALQFFYAFELLRDKRRLGMVWKGLLIVLIGLNILQYCQNWKWIYPEGAVNSNSYWKHFFSLKPTAEVLMPADTAILFTSTFSNNLEEEMGWINESTRSKERAYSGEWSSRIDKEDTLGIGIVTLVKPYIRSETVEAKISADILVQDRQSGLKLVIDFVSDDESYNYTAFDLHPYLRKNQWEQVEFIVEVPPLRSEHDEMKVYFYDSRPTLPVYIDDVRIDLYSLREEKKQIFSATIPEHLIVHRETIYNDMEADAGWLNSGTRTVERSLTGKYSSKADSANPFSIGWSGEAQGYFTTNNRKVRISAFVYSPEDSVNCYLVADLYNDSVQYFYRAYPLKSKTGRYNWTYINFMIDIPADLKSDDKLKIYFWNPDKKAAIYIDLMEIQFISLHQKILKQMQFNDYEVFGSVVFKTEMEGVSGWDNDISLTGDKACFGEGSARLTKDWPYSPALKKRIKDVVTSGKALIRVSGYVWTDAVKSRGSLVVDFRSKAGSYLYIPYYLNDRTRWKGWKYIEFTTIVPDTQGDDDQVWIYFMNASTDETIYVDRVTVEFISLKE